MRTIKKKNGRQLDAPHVANIYRRMKAASPANAKRRAIYVALAILVGLSGATTLLSGQALARSKASRIERQQASSKDSREGVAHLLNRVTFGIRPGDVEKVQALGVERYLKEQLSPDSIALPSSIQQVAQVPALTENPVNLFLNYGKPALKALSKGGGNTEADKKALGKIVRDTYGKLYQEAAQAHLTRAIDSPRQLQEVMTDFWFNHFNVSSDKGLDHIWVGQYEESAIRPHALGRFRDMLGATAHHAAMLFYLDNWQNTAASFRPVVNNPNNSNNPKAKSRFKGINENYARELMELHTLGVDGGYTQKDVQELARVLTGLGLPPGAGGGFAMRNPQERRRMLGQFQGNQSQIMPFGQRSRQRGIRNFGEVVSASSIPGDAKSGSYFDARRHDPGTKVIMGQTIAGAGEREIEQVLDILARHPSTAHHISYKLAQYFVADTPPESLVKKMAATFTRTDGQIAAVLNTLFESEEFWNPQNRNNKFKSPYRYVVSSLRATDATIVDVVPVLAYLKQAGQPLYKCLTPNGYKNTQEAWLNPDSLINRLNFATALGANRLPGVRTENNKQGDITDSLAIVSEKTVSAIEQAQPQLRQSLVLGSPEFMMY
ncbi:MAG: DUF1800 domain-containing protein [Cyanobacteria bacterium DS2.3.42]|nr:DUF1800 domain-containing protein [Cyanobacteria bacterium DS2.3.42]